MEINKVCCKDYLELLKGLPSESVDLLHVDPPYEFISKNPKGGGFMSKEKKKHLDKINDSFGMTFDPEKLLAEAKRVLKKFNAYIFTNKNLLKLYIDFADSNKYKWEIFVLFKIGALPLNSGHYHIDKEYCLYIKESGATFNSNLHYSKYKTVYSYPIGNRGQKHSTHPCEKPLNLIDNTIQISTNKDDIVLDCFCGSGGVAEVCGTRNRKFICCDNDREWADKTQQRVDKLLERKLF